MSRGIRTSENRDDGRTRGMRVLTNVPNEVTSLRTAVRIQTRISMVSGL